MDKNKIIEKIKKCMALGKSSNVNEAAAALRQAQKMMDMHGLTEDDIEGSSFGNEAVECPIQVGNKTPIHLNAFVALIQKAFQVKAVVESNKRVSDYSYRIRYFGPLYRVTTAAYAHVVIFRAMEAAWRKELKESPQFRGVRGARLSFMVGWLHEIASKVEAIGWPEGEEARTELIKKNHYTALTTPKPREFMIREGLASKGRAAGADFNINRPMNKQHKELEKL